MRTQFQVLYREFLFRMIDLELVSSQGDTSRLLGQFAALLIYISSALGLGALFFDGRRMTPDALLIAHWRIEHSYVSITMLVVGLFAVLSWDSTFPDRRDVLVLSPLPIRTRTLFLAKIAASGAALSVTVFAINACTGVAWPFALAAENTGFLELFLSPIFYRAFATYWITMMTAGAFIFCSVLGLQGLVAQLPRQMSLRLSALFQMATFCLLLIMYFLEPALAAPKALTAAQNQRLLAWLPSYWFLAVFHQLNGSMHPALAPLVWRAWTGLAVASLAATAVSLLAYFRTLRKIADQPDISPARRRIGWAARLGGSLEGALALFSARTLLRSRRHRMMLAFYLGIGFAIVIAFLSTPRAQHRLISDRAPLMFSSVVMMSVWVVGIRVVFAMPIALPANWIFRMTEVRRAAQYLAGIRRSLCVLAVAPVWVVSAGLFVSIWPWRQAAGHLIVLGLCGMTLAYLCLHGFQKIPFTCSYLPGKIYFHMVFLAVMGFLFLLLKGIELELRALEDPVSYAKMMVILGAAVLLARWLTVRKGKSAEAALQFEDIPPPVIFALDLHNERKLVR